jgi:hypothetical protein
MSNIIEQTTLQSATCMKGALGLFICESYDLI